MVKSSDIANTSSQENSSPPMKCSWISIIFPLSFQAKLFYVLGVSGKYFSYSSLCQLFNSSWNTLQYDQNEGRGIETDTSSSSLSTSYDNLLSTLIRLLVRQIQSFQWNQAVVSIKSCDKSGWNTLQYDQNEYQSLKIR